MFQEYEVKSNSYRAMLRNKGQGDGDDDDDEDDSNEEDVQPYPKRRKTFTKAQVVQKKVHLLMTGQSLKK